MFSKACEYAIKSILHIAHCSQSGNRIDLKSIAKAIDSPEAFTAKILHKMSKSKLINSRKGPYGGFEMSEEKRKSITLSQLVLAIDGDDIYSNCALGLKKCNDLEPCPIHDQYKGIKADFKYMLENTTIEQLAQKLNQEKITLK